MYCGIDLGSTYIKAAIYDQNISLWINKDSKPLMNTIIVGQNNMIELNEE